MYEVPNWRKIPPRNPRQPTPVCKPKSAKPVQRLEPSPCEDCHKADRDNCTKTIDPHSQNTCKRWEDWCRVSWRSVVRTITGADG